MKQERSDNIHPDNKTSSQDSPAVNRTVLSATSEEEKQRELEERRRELEEKIEKLKKEQEELEKELEQIKKEERDKDMNSQAAQGKKTPTSL